MERKAVVLLSGGIDSTTALAIARSQHFQIYAISFRYGQRHALELKSASKIASQLKVVKHLIVDLDLRKIGGSALTDNLEVPKLRVPSQIEAEIPVTYVPARNIIFLSLALGWAETLEAYDIFIGVNILDYSGYPDCRPEFISSFENMANLGTRAGVSGKRFKIHSPLITFTKAQIIQKGSELGIDYSMTISCYDPSKDEKSCGTCDSCILRKKGFHEAGIPDPTIYC